MRYITNVGELAEKSRIAIYGAGSAGVHFKSELDARRPDVAVACFADSFKTGHIEHTPILKPGDLAGLGLDEIVICSHKYGDIGRSLESLGLSNLAVFGAPLKDVFDGSGLKGLTQAGGAFDVSGLEAVRSGCEPTPCHLKALFVRHDGAIFPCCNVRNIQRYCIGHVADPDILDRIAAFEAPCSCVGKTLRRKTDDEALRTELLNIEFSLRCQARCAMCCVDAPQWRGRYDLYGALARLVEALEPASMLTQGGEVLVQPATLRWLGEIKAARPGLRIGIVTNGNVKASLAPEIEPLFDSMSISVVGFQPATYRAIMGLDIRRMKAFARAVRRGGRIALTLKYLCTANNFHEMPLFLDWAMKLKPVNISLCDSLLVDSINLETRERFWLKILRRTAADVRRLLVQAGPVLAGDAITVRIEPSVKILLETTPEFIRDNALEGVVA